MKYSELAELYDKLERTSKRIDKTLQVSDFLKKADEQELEELALLIEGRVFPAWDQRETGVAAQLIVKALQLATGADEKKVKDEWKKTGDLGLVAQSLSTSKKQATLHSEQISVTKVFSNIRKLAGISGHGSVEQKLQLIAELLTSAKPLESKYIIRTILNQMRMGVGQGVMRDAIAWAYLPHVKGLFDELDARPHKKVLQASDTSKLKNIESYDLIEAPTEKEAREIYNFLVDAIQQAYDLTSDFGEVAAAAKANGITGLRKIKMKVGIPIKVMLAQKVDSIEDAFEKTGKPLQAEFKLDGFRVQIHRKGELMKVFTRRLEDVSAQFPDIVSAAKANVKADNYILDAEAAGYDRKTKKYLPFQKISQRIKRKYGVGEIVQQFPVEINVFDIISLDGENLISEPFKKRRELIEKIIKPIERVITPSRKLISSDAKEIDEFFLESKEKGNEGLMLKNLDAPYKPGSRVGNMLKYKRTMENLDLAIVAAEWGDGKRSKWLSSYTVACWDGTQFLEVGKASTGLKEKKEEGLSFEEMTKLLKPLVKSEDGKTVFVKPKIVIEVGYEEIQKSTTYNSGYALRFPRVIGLREDKPATEASTIEQVEQYYGEQMKK